MTWGMKGKGEPAAIIYPGFAMEGLIECNNLGNEGGESGTNV
jgi:hypothetical protein